MSVLPPKLITVNKLDSDIIQLEGALKARYATFTDGKLIEMVEGHISSVLEGNVEKTIDVYKKTLDVLRKFDEFKTKRKIIEYSDFSFSAKIARFFTQTVVAFFGCEPLRIYIQVLNPLDVPKADQELHAAINDVYKRDAPQGDVPEEDLEANVWGVAEDDATKRLRVWIKKPGAKVDVFDVNMDGEVLEFQGKKYSSWGEIGTKIQAIVGNRKVKNVDEMRKGMQAELGQFSVKKEKPLSGDEWCVKQKNNYTYELVKPAGKTTFFSITGDGRLKCGERLAKSLPELFPELKAEECLARKYSREREETLKRILEKGVVAQYRLGELYVNDTNMGKVSEIKGKGSFYVVENEKKIYFISYEEGKTHSVEEFSILEDGSLTPKEPEKNKVTVGASAKTKIFDIEKEKLKVKADQMRYSIKTETGKFEVQLPDCPAISAETFAELERKIRVEVCFIKQLFLTKQCGSLDIFRAQADTLGEAAIGTVFLQTMDQDWGKIFLYKVVSVKDGKAQFVEETIDLLKNMGEDGKVQIGFGRYENLDQYVRSKGLLLSDRFELLFANKEKMRAEAAAEAEKQAALEREGKEFIDNLIRDFDVRVPLDSLKDMVASLSALRVEERTQPWTLQKPQESKEESKIEIRQGINMDEALQVDVVKKDDRWVFQIKEGNHKGLYGSLEALLIVHGLVLQDSVKEIKARKERFDALEQELTGERTLQFFRGKKHDFYHGQIDTNDDLEMLNATMKSMKKRISSKNELAAVYRRDGLYYLLHYPRVGDPQTSKIEMRTYPVAYFECNGKKGKTLAEILPDGVVTLKQAARLEPQAKREETFFSIGETSFFTELTSLENVKKKCEPLCGSLSEREKIVIVFLDEAKKYRVCVFAKGKPVETAYVEQDGEAIDLYEDAAKEQFINSYESFAEFCFKDGTRAITLQMTQQLQASPKSPQAPIINPVEDFKVDGRQFFLGKSDPDTMKKAFSRLTEGVKPGQRMWGVFEQDRSYYLCSFNGDKKEFQFRKCRKESDGRFSLQQPEGAVKKERSDTFANLCHALHAMTYDQVDQNHKKENQPQLVPQGAQKVVLKRPDWLDRVGQVSDYEVKKDFPGLVLGEGSLQSSRDFCLWVKGLALARTKEEMTLVVAAKGRMKQFSVVDLFYLYELVLGSNIVQAGTKRQKNAMKIISEVLTESLKEPAKKRALLEYFKQNKEAYGDALAELLEGIKSSFTEAELQQL